LRVLIIDDDETTGYLLKYWLTDGSLKEDGIKTIYRQHCKDASEIINKEKIDLVLMDVNMPNMNGIECTKKLKENFPDLLIIAISSDNDENIQNDMLKVGAYDYLSKPLVEDIFTKRIKTYMLLSGLKNSPKKESAVNNLFKDKVFNFHINFPVYNEDSLVELWGAMLVRFSYYQNINDLHNTVSNIYTFGLEMFKVQNELIIVIEENENFLYFTIKSTLVIDKTIVKNLTDNYNQDMFIVDNNKTVSIKLNKLSETENSINNNSISISTKQYVLEEKLEELEIFSIFDNEEMDDFDNQLFLIQTSLKRLNNSYSKTDLEQISLSIDKLASIFMHHNELKILYRCMLDFKNILLFDIDTKQKFEDTYKLISTYIEDIFTWNKKVFLEGSPSINFMDDSFVANIGTIKSFLVPQDSSSSIDDIFDF